MPHERLDELDPRRARGGRPWRRITQHIRAHGGNTCHLCGKAIDKTLPSWHLMSFTVDHIVPLAKGGHPTELSNLAPAHRTCNRDKSDHMIIDERADNQSIDW